MHADAACLTLDDTLSRAFQHERAGRSSVRHLPGSSHGTTHTMSGHSTASTVNTASAAAAAAAVSDGSQMRRMARRSMLLGGPCPPPCWPALSARSRVQLPQHAACCEVLLRQPQPVALSHPHCKGCGAAPAVTHHASSAAIQQHVLATALLPQLTCAVSTPCSWNNAQDSAS